MAYIHTHTHTSSIECDLTLAKQNALYFESPRKSSFAHCCKEKKNVEQWFFFCFIYMTWREMLEKHFELKLNLFSQTSFTSIDELFNLFYCEFLSICRRWIRESVFISLTISISAFLSLSFQFSHLQSKHTLSLSSVRLLARSL